VRALLVIAAIVVLTSYFTRPQSSANSHSPLLVGAKIDSGTRQLIERSCRDCHSDTTRYPWYSYVAPVSWLIDYDVQQGREHLNLSRWEEYSLIRRERALSEIANQVRDGAMPLWQYTWIHRNTRLSNADADAIFQWTQAERLRLILGSIEKSSPPH
jgi:Haem-binding domain